MCVTVLSAQIYHECEMPCPVLRIWRQHPLLPALRRLPVGRFTIYSKYDASSKQLAVSVSPAVETGCDCECLPSEHCAYSLTCRHLQQHNASGLALY